MAEIFPSAFVDHYRVLGALGRGLPDYARSRGIEIEPIAAAVGLPLAAFEAIDADISLDRFCRLLEVLATIAKDETFALRFAETYQTGGSGAFGYGLKSAPDLRAALEFCAKYATVLADATYLELRIDGREARFEWRLPDLVVKRDQFLDLCASLLVRQLRFGVDSGWRPVEVRLQRRAPPSSTLYRRQLAPRVVFGGELNAIVVSVESLDRKNGSADPLLFELMTRQCAEQTRARRAAGDIAARVREAVLEGLAAGHATTARIAPRLGISERSLQRHLADLGLSFQRIVDEARRELSDRLLRDSNLSIAEISHRLGFAAPSAYTRSAMRWYGKPPSAARRALAS